ncbi:MAG: hypothetical protein R2688_06795 [Fimbriimonadaceae bacterium]
MPWMLATLALTTNLSNLPQDLVDADNDGLPDQWEVEGHGPIDPKFHNCKPGRADIFVVFRMRSDMTEKEIRPTIEKIRKFYADLPYKNPDGSTGLNLIEIIPEPLDKKYDSTDYKSLYNQGMPKEWRGFAHGVMMSKSTRGGGQANRPDWCGTGNNVPTIIHEVGHQLGLGHRPPGSTDSPFHTGLMNYDYLYQFNGKADLIHFSSGHLSKMEMKENDLSEVVPYPIADVKFLSNRPYYYKLKEIGANSTAIDWNRNGIFGETGIKADINDGYSRSAGGHFEVTGCAGAPVMLTYGEELLSVYPATADKEDSKGYAKAGLDAANQGMIRATFFNGNKEAAKQILITDSVAGEISAVIDGDTLLVAYPTLTGFVIATFDINKEGEDRLMLMNRQVVQKSNQVPTLVSTPNGVKVITWDAIDHTVRIGDASNPNATTAIPSMQSNFPVAAVWNPKKNQIGIISVNNQGSKKNRLQLHHIAQNDEGVTIAESVWVEGSRGNAATNARPTAIFDSSPTAGPNGSYQIFFHQNVGANARGLNYLARQIEDPTLSEGWRVKMMINEWSYSRSACGATFFNDEIVYAIRGYGSKDGKTEIWLRASGIENKIIKDYDEVGHIFTKGLKDSLERVRKEFKIK